MRCLALSSLSASILALASGCGGPADWEPLTVVRGISFVEVQVDGTWTTCLVDTGASGSLVRSDLASSEEVVFTFASAEADEDVTADPALDAMLDSLSATAGADVGCILGWDVLRDLAVTVDYSSDAIRFARSARDLDDPIVVALERTAPIPMVAARVDGVEVVAAVDTGASVVHLEPEVFERLDPTPETKKAQVSSANGVALADFGVLSEVRVDARTDNDVAFEAYASPEVAAIRRDGYDLDGILGASWLMRFAVTFDADRGELLLQPYDADVRERLLERLHEDIGVAPR